LLSIICIARLNPENAYVNTGRDDWILTSAPAPEAEVLTDYDIFLDDTTCEMENGRVIDRDI